MSTNNILPYNDYSVKTTLSNGESVVVPEGADPQAFRRYMEAKIRLANSPRKVSKKSPPRRRVSKKSNYARMQSVLSQATLELVERVHQPADEPQTSILWTVKGETADFTSVLKVR